MALVTVLAGLIGVEIGSAAPAYADAGPVQVLSGPSYGFVDPLAVASDGTHVWVANWTSVTELDASSGAPIQVIPLSSYDTAAISSDGTHVWAESYNQVTEIDASTGSIIQVIPGPFDVPTGISSDGNHVWVTDGTYSTNGEGSLTEIDASTGSIIREISGGSDGIDDPWSVSSDGAHVWVANSSSSSVSELDASTGSLIQVITGLLYDEHAISSDGTHVWVANAGQVAELDASTGTVVQYIDGSFVYPSGISSDGTHVWLASWYGTVSEFDAGTGALVVALSDPSYGFPDHGLSDVISDGTHVWVTNEYGNSLTMLNTYGVTGISAEVSGGGQTGSSISVADGTAVTDQATLQGSTPNAGGTVTYNVFSDPSCSALVGTSDTVTVTNASVPASASEIVPPNANYFWQASYSGDALNTASTTPCGPLDVVEGVGFHVTTLTIPNATRRVPYSFFLGATGVVSPYPLIWKKISGSLPPYVSVRASGRIYGNPPKTDKPGAYTFVVRVSTRAYLHHPAITTTQTLTIELQ